VTCRAANTPWAGQLKDPVLIQQAIEPSNGEATGIGGAWSQAGWAERGAAAREPFLRQVWRGLRRRTVGRVIGALRRRAIRLVQTDALKILEIGTGTGSGLSAYARDADVIGTDGNRQALADARARVARKAMDHVSGLYQMPASQLRFDDRRFDLVTAFFVLRRARDPRRVIREMVRLTRPGGRIVVVDRLLARRSLTRPAHAASAWSSIAGRFGAHDGGPVRISLLARSHDLELLRRRGLDPFGFFTVAEFARRS